MNALVKPFFLRHDFPFGIWNDLEGNYDSLKAQTKETETNFLLAFELPGVKKENLDIEVEDNILHVRAKRFHPLHEDEEGVEIKKAYRLPKTVQAEAIKAKLEDGLLFLELPKIPESRPRKIKIEAIEGGGDNLLGNE